MVLIQRISISCSNCPFQAKIKELENTIAQLEAKLAKYENPHVPPSMQKFKQKEEEHHEPKKRGAPIGHKGVTRPKTEPNETIKVTSDSCDQCGSKNLALEDVEEILIEDLPPPPKIKVTRYIKHFHKCLDCGNEFAAKHPDCPKEGKFGINLLVHITMLKFGLRGVHRRIGDFTGHANSFEISPTSIQDILLRVGRACDKEYLRTLERIKAAE